MARQVDLLCLANSTKHGHRCIAGLDLDTGDWIRPVSDLSDGALSRKHYLTKDGHEPVPLDSIKISLDASTPDIHQPENWRITADPWEVISTELDDRSTRVLNRAVLSGSSLFGNHYDSIEEPDENDSSVTSSLALVSPEKAQFYIRKSDNRAQLRTDFELDGVKYDLAVTDPIWKRKIFSNDELSWLKYKPASAYHDDGSDILFTISLGTPYNGRCYKLVAAIIPIPAEVLNSSNHQN